MPTVIPNPEIQKDVEKANLRYVSDDSPGITRKGVGTSFYYVDRYGKRINDTSTLERIEKLAIPPAWESVWIAPFANGHIQATGRDEKGRKQYIYHEEWNRIMQENKFNKLLFFSEVLPTLRREIYEGMQERGLTQRRVLATIVWLLEKTYIRIGNQEYAKENDSYGLTTLRMKHVDVSGDTVKFEFRGKSGKEHEVEIEHPRVAKTIRKLEELPGYELFQYVDSDGNRRLIQSDDVNEYLKKITGEDITAKDFRTWGGTVYAGDALYELGPFETKTQEKKNIASAVKKVSQHLRNTTTVCRCYYIHPTVIETYEKKILIPHFDETKKKIDKKPQRLSFDEFAVTTLLQQYAK